MDHSPSKELNWDLRATFWLYGRVHEDRFCRIGDCILAVHWLRQHDSARSREAGSAWPGAQRTGARAERREESREGRREAGKESREGREKGGEGLMRSQGAGRS